MARWWIKLPTLALAGLCFGAAVADAQQPGEPPYYAPSGAYPVHGNTASGETDGMPVGAPVPMPHPGYQLPSAYWPQAGYPGPYGPPAGVIPPAYAPAMPAEGDYGAADQKSGLLHSLKSKGCNCEGGDGHANPIHHFLLMDCWAHHDEMGCSSFCGEARFAFGSCRAYFGERCGPNPPRIPVPPGYTVLPPDIRSGPPVEVPPNPYPKNRQ